MKKYNIALLPGDGVGEEVTNEAVKVLNVLGQKTGIEFSFKKYLIGGCAYDKFGTPLPEETVNGAKNSDAVLLGAVGDKIYDTLPPEVRPEKALLGIRKALNLFANLRPAKVFEISADNSTIKKDIVSGVDIMIVRELVGGIYFGEPRGIKTRNGEKVGFNTMVYSEGEIRRIADVAFQTAQKRKKKVCSVDKANVLDVSRLWREVVTEVGKNYPDIELTHMYVDNAAMQLVKNPKQFDVIVTGNLFGDILSDEASMLTGSLGLMPSASLSSGKPGLFEPVHGSAPDIKGQNIVNPCATILSAAMMLKHGLDEQHAGDIVENAVKSLLEEGYGTPDIISDKNKILSTTQTGDMIADKILNF